MKFQMKKALLFAAMFVLLTGVITAVAVLAGEPAYTNIQWSFEEGKLEPFFTNDDWGTIRLIVNRDTDRNDGVTPINKHGKHYLCTVLFDDMTNYDERYVGHVMSPDFRIYDPVVKLKIAGGPNCYVAVVRADDGAILGKISNPTGSGHPMKEVTLDLGKNYKEGERVYIDIVDNMTAGWGFITVDDIRVVGKVCEDERVMSGDKALSDLIGYEFDLFDNLSDIAEGYAKSYPKFDNAALNAAIENVKKAWKDIADREFTASEEGIEKLKNDLSELVRLTALSHPGLNGKQLVFVARNQYDWDHHNTHTMFPSYDGEFNNGRYQGDSAIRIYNLATNQTTTLASNKYGVYRDLEVSNDGTKILYSYRKDINDSYHIYESVVKDGVITETKQLTTMADVDDMDPLYLPSGEIVFSSTRDPKYVMCNRHISANIYRMNGDGSNIVKITNSTLFERPSDVMSDGRILYDRWEYVDRDFGSAQGVWTVNPDGTLQNTYYGNNTPTGAFVDAKDIPGTNKIVATMTSTHDRPWGGIVIIDRSAATDGKEAIQYSWPQSLAHSIGEAGGNLNIDATKGLSLKYEDPLPLDENYFLVSRQISQGSEKTGIYLIDTFGNELLLYEDESGLGAYDVRLLEAKEDVEFILSSRRDYADNYGTFFVQDVYEGTHMQGVERGSVAYLRVIEVIPKLSFITTPGWSGQGEQAAAVNWHSFEVKRILGDVPVYEDGSAYFAVSQDAFVYFQLISEDGRMIQSMRSGTLIQSGERTGCVGCHEDAATTPLSSSKHGTPIALEKSFTVVDGVGVNVPDQITRAEYMPEGTLNYLTEIQPIFTDNCISCHGYESPKADLTLVPDKTLVFNTSYVDLWRSRSNGAGTFQNMVNVIGGGGTEFTPAKSWGSYVSPLVQKLYDENDPHSTYLSDSERRAIAMWVDANAPYYGDYATNYPNSLAGRCPLTTQELARLTGLKYSANYYDTGKAQIYFDNPEKSPYLKRYAVGSVQYEAALKIIQTGADRLAKNPDVDMEGYVMNALDAWRLEKFQWRAEIEAANREAIQNGQKLYDSDHASGQISKFPGFN